MLVVVEVGVALSRPPRVDRLSRVVVEVPFTGSFQDAETEAALIACQMAAVRPEVVMPVSSVVVDVLAV